MSMSTGGQRSAVPEAGDQICKGVGSLLLARGTCMYLRIPPVVLHGNVGVCFLNGIMISTGWFFCVKFPECSSASFCLLWRVVMSGEAKCCGPIDVSFGQFAKINRPNCKNCWLIPGIRSGRAGQRLADAKEGPDSSRMFQQMSHLILI